MDARTAKIRYQRWVQVIQDWIKSGLSKRDYCQQNEIDEKQFYANCATDRTVLHSKTYAERSERTP